MTLFGELHQAPQIPSSIALASYLGLSTVLQRLLNAYSDHVDTSFGEAARTPLGWAAQGGYTNVASLLLNTGKANIEATDSENCTPLRLACNSRDEPTALCLLSKGADPGYYDTEDTSALSDAASMGLLRVTNWILENLPQSELDDLVTRYNSKGSSALHLAVLSNDKDQFPIVQAARTSRSRVKDIATHTFTTH
jgi:hypothetical protein